MQGNVEALTFKWGSSRALLQTTKPYHPRGSWKSHPVLGTAAWGGRLERAPCSWDGSPRGLPWGDPGCVSTPSCALPIPPTPPKWPGGRACRGLALFLSASRICELVPEGNRQWGGVRMVLAVFWLGGLVGVFFLHFRGLFVCLVLTVFSLFPAGALPRGPAGCLCFGGVVESKDFCAHHPCCEMQTCACFASLAET